MWPAPEDELYLRCSCYETDHLLVAVMDCEEKEMYIETGLSHFHPFWKRVLVALKYIFKRPLRFQGNHFSTIVLSPKQVERLRDHCDRFLSCINELPKNES